MTYDVIRQIRNAVANAGNILKIAQAHDEANGTNLLEARLAEDMFNFTKQVQTFTDLAKFGPSRLTGKKAPSFEDNETTYEELHTRLEKTLAHIDSFEADDFKDSATLDVMLRFFPGPLSGTDYLHQFLIPNFYFHLTTAYAILRHNGVALGKRDFLGQMNFQITDD